MFNNTFHPKYPYDNVVILIQNTNELEEAKPIIERYVNFSNYLNIKGNLESSNIPQYIRICNSSSEVGTLDIRHGSLNYYKSTDFDYNHEKLFTINDLRNNLLEHIINNGVSNIPNYKPRTIIKKLDEAENTNFYLRYAPEVPPILTPLEQKEQFKIGDIVFVRPDAFEYYYDVDVDEMECFLGKKIKIEKIQTVHEQYGYRYEDSLDTLGKDIKTDDFMITGIPLEDDCEGIWVWYYRCLFNPKDLMKPSYKPKNIKKDINEKLNEMLYTELSILPYFRKYNSFILKSTAKKEDDEYDKVIDILISIFELDIEINAKGHRSNMYEYGIGHDFYFVIYLNDNGEFRRAWDFMTSFESNKIRHNHSYSKIYTLDEINTKHKVLQILNNAGSPTYEPKKFKRVLESADILNIKKNGKNITIDHTQKDAIPFAINENKLMIGEPGTTHVYFWKDEAENAFRNDYYISPKNYEKEFGKIAPPLIPINEIEEYFDMDFKDYFDDLYSEEFMERLEDLHYMGRLWLDSKVIAFWDYPETNEKLHSLICDLEKRLNINIWNNGWSIPIWDDNKEKLIKLEEFEKSLNPSEEDWREHIKSPLLKTKKVIPNFGSSSPTYKDKRIWQMASMTDESVSLLKESSFFDDNNQLNKYMIENKDYPKYMIGDKVIYNDDEDFTKYNIFYNQDKASYYEDTFKFIEENKNKTFVIKAKFKGDLGDIWPWWSEVYVLNGDPNNSMYLLDVQLKGLPNYQPRIIRREI